MQVQINEVAELNKTSLNAALDVTLALMDGFERLYRLQLEATKSLFRESLDAVRRVGSAVPFADPMPEALTLGAGSINKIVGYSRNLSDIASATSVQLLNVTRSAAPKWHKGWADLSDGLSSSIGLGANDATGAALKSVMSASAAVLEGLTRTAKQSIELAHTALSKAAASAAAEAGKVAVPAKG